MPAPPATTEIAVPLLDLTAQYRPLRDEILAAIARVCDSQRFILGAEVEAFEREIAAQLEIEHAIGVSSGTDALLVSLMALGVGPGDEVITPDFSFFATAGCVSRLGATPVFVDIDPSTFNVDPASAARAIGPKTRAIVPVHLFGLPADMDPLIRLAQARGIHVIEDAAQSIGARYRGHITGGIGLAGILSFFPSKNLGAFGDAGLVLTRDARFATDVRLLRGHGMDPKYVHRRIGGNFRLDALQAAVLRVKAPHTAAWSNARRRNADRYRSLFDEYGLADMIRLPVEPDGLHHVYNQFVIRAPRRDALREHLASRRIGTEIYYPIPLRRQECFAGLPLSDCPASDEAAASSLALPIFGELTADQQRHVVASIAEFYGR
jgi:dTDP-4-amino-4,6-dideoxygalactose transaminase